MKKLLIAAIALMGFSAASFAQTPPAAKKAEPAKMQIVKKADQKADAKVVAMTKPTEQKAKKAAASTATAATAHTSATAAQVKKDGTPDMRYKQNKDAAKAAPAAHLKKDGTKDMRYKENKKNK